MLYVSESTLNSESLYQPHIYLIKRHLGTVSISKAPSINVSRVTKVLCPKLHVVPSLLQATDSWHKAKTNQSPFSDMTVIVCLSGQQVIKAIRINYSI